MSERDDDPDDLTPHADDLSNEALDEVAGGAGGPKASLVASASRTVVISPAPGAGDLFGDD
jgi:hypothetical protein